MRVSPRIAGIATLLPGVFVAQMTVANLIGLAGADWSTDSGGAALLTVLLVMVVAVIAAVAVATLIVGIAYLRGMRRRTPGAMLGAIHIGFATLATTSAAENALWTWIGYAMLGLVAVWASVLINERDGAE